MRSYETARVIHSIVEFLSWAVIVVGVLVALGAAGAASQFGRGMNGMAMFMAALPGLAVTFVGLLGVCQVQNGRAAVDSAEYAQQMLKIARDQLAVSNRSLKQAERANQSYEAMVAASEAPAPASPYAEAAETAKPVGEKPAITMVPSDGNTITYRGFTIIHGNNRYYLDQVELPSLEEAHARIDKMLDRPRQAATTTANVIPDVTPDTERN